jgi:hypothetical protein
LCLGVRPGIARMRDQAVERPALDLLAQQRCHSFECAGGNQKVVTDWMLPVVIEGGENPKNSRCHGTFCAYRAVVRIRW